MRAVLLACFLSSGAGFPIARNVARTHFLRTSPLLSSSNSEAARTLLPQDIPAFVMNSLAMNNFPNVDSGLYTTWGLTGRWFGSVVITTVLRWYLFDIKTSAIETLFSPFLCSFSGLTPLRKFQTNKQTKRKYRAWISQKMIALCQGTLPDGFSRTTCKTSLTQPTKQRLSFPQASTAPQWMVVASKWKEGRTLSG